MWNCGIIWLILYSAFSAFVCIHSFTPYWWVQIIPVNHVKNIFMNICVYKLIAITALWCRVSRGNFAERYKIRDEKRKIHYINCCTCSYSRLYVFHHWLHVLQRRFSSQRGRGDYLCVYSFVRISVVFIFLFYFLFFFSSTWTFAATIPEELPSSCNAKDTGSCETTETISRYARQGNLPDKIETTRCKNL